MSDLLRSIKKREKNIFCSKTPSISSPNLKNKTKVSYIYAQMAAFYHNLIYNIYTYISNTHYFVI